MGLPTVETTRCVHVFTLFPNFAHASYLRSLHGDDSDWNHLRSQ